MLLFCVYTTGPRGRGRRGGVPTGGVRSRRLPHLRHAPGAPVAASRGPAPRRHLRRGNKTKRNQIVLYHTTSWFYRVKRKRSWFLRRYLLARERGAGEAAHACMHACMDGFFMLRCRARVGGILREVLTLFTLFSHLPARSRGGSQ